LSKLPPEQQAEVWQQITQENSDSKVTAKKVKEFIEQIQQNAGTIQEKVLVTKDAKRIHKALSVLSEYESGKIREAILSDSGEALQMPQLVEKILLTFKNLEL
jgi:ribosomal protein L18E